MFSKPNEDNSSNGTGNSVGELVGTDVGDAEG